MTGLTKQRLFWAVAAAAIAALHILSMLGKPLGSIADESFFLVMGRNILEGSFCFPDAAGLPVTSHMPGLPLLLAIPVLFAEPHWMAIRTLELAALGIGLYAAWSLARKAMPSSWAAGTALLISVNSALSAQAGVILTEIPFMALSMVLFRLAAESDSRKNLLLLAAGTALAALMRPHGAILALCLGLGVWHRSGQRKALIFALFSLGPLAAWYLRNYLLSRSVTHYMSDWRLQMPFLWDPADSLRHAVRLIQDFFGKGVLGITDPVLALWAGCLILIVAAYGAVLLIREGRTWAFIMSANAVLVIALHMTWLQTSTRYSVPLIPIVLILAAVGARSWLRSSPRASVLLALLLGALSLRGTLSHALKGLRGPPPVVQASTFRWIRHNTEPQARFESLTPSAVTLMTRRPAYLPVQAILREAWFAGLLDNGVRFVEVKTSPLESDGFLPPAAQYIIANHARWSSASPYLVEVFRSISESTVLFRVEHPDPQKFLAAWMDYKKAVLIQQGGGPPEKIRRLLTDALLREPDMACARDLLAELATGP